MLISLEGKNDVYEFSDVSSGSVLQDTDAFFKTFKGVCKSNSLPVIIKKVMPIVGTQGPAHVSLLRDIFLNIGALHSAIAGYLDVVEHEQTVYIVREYISGVNLHTILFDPDYPHLRNPYFFKAIVFQLCEILQKLHTHGIVHRDIKPSNIIVETNELGKVDMYNPRVKFLDFERAQITGQSLFQFPRTPFSLQYSSPEQVLKYDNLLGVTTDVYSLGITIFEMFARQPPYNTDNTNLILNLQIAYPLKKTPLVPKTLFVLLQKATHKHVFQVPPGRLPVLQVQEFLLQAITARYQTISEFSSDLELFFQAQMSKKKQKSMRVFPFLFKKTK